MHRDELLERLNHWLEPQKFSDVAENGLQVEGTENIERVVCGVSANSALIEAAIAAEAQAIVVHHGLVWGDGIRNLCGWLGKRVRQLMNADINLYAYHLPLDAHPKLGNNAALADILRIGEDRSPFGEYKGQLIGVAGELDSPQTLAQLIERIRTQVGEPLCTFGDPEQVIRQIGVCSGGAPELLYEAIDEGYDAYLTGEATEWVKSVAEESGVAFISAGHHATERFGARRIAEALGRETELHAEFIDVANPV